MITQKTDVIIVDAGNTRIKVASFYNGEITNISRFKLTDRQFFGRFVIDSGLPPVFISSVLSDKDLTELIQGIPNVLCFSSDMKLPVTIGYESRETLGLDRLANAAALQLLNPQNNSVSVDLGTCIKFDFVDNQGVYWGGSISPGLSMRYRSLHDFTGKLPLLQPQITQKIFGRNTYDSIHLGVIQGIQGELNHFMKSYYQEYQGLTFFVTGGDANFFEFPVKNNIFADENLTLKGLFHIYQLND